ncbi:uncharacterized protein BYT42DRAFT_516605 [Radiomyces spectabilis]|uniref:uncharacterized protein n=1 Tax=Radiomyces spectabilis TaxID=64574 RepID=UPI0022207A88|nr:uncharacterized protein BYT42DRAFT_516605 [Radiomyces spectabilis]KAI8375968.1 hypothetical protein BYT42DRAFT_516605 [Radiomyces spectabilis]
MESTSDPALTLNKKSKCAQVQRDVIPGQLCCVPVFAVIAIFQACASRTIHSCFYLPY